MKRKKALSAVVAAASRQFAIMGATVFAVEFFVDYFEAHERTIEGFWHYITDSEA
jgi:hypothetical protein